MFDHGFPPEWSTLKKLIWLVGAGIIGGASAVWKTVTGTLIHLTDALASPMQKCEVTLEPIQDLHGQDAPYPAGGGVNKFNVGSIVPYNSNATVTKDGGSFTVTNNNSYVAAMFCDSAGHIMQFPVSDGKYTISIGEATTVAIGVYGSTDGETFSWLSNGITSGNTSAVFTVNGQNFVEFRASAPANGSATIKNFQFESGNSATPYSPYSNICPITGWTGCEVTRTGKNLLDKSKAKLYNNISRFIKYGVNSWSDTVPNGDCILDAGTYTISLSGNNIVAPQTLGVRDANDSQIAVVYNQNKLTFTISASGAYVIVINFVDVVTWTDYNIQLERGSTATDYEPFNGTTLSVTFPDSAGTVYGGTVDLVSGLLTVDTVKAVADGTQSPTDYDEHFIQFISKFPTAAGYNPTDINLKCNRLKPSGYTERNNNVIFFSNAVVIFFRVSESVSNWTTYLQNNPVEFSYKIAEPIEIQLTPQEISTLAGENNVWSNGDSVEITYKAQSS